MWENKREPKVVMGARKRQAQVAAGKLRDVHRDRVAQAQDRLAEAEATVRDDNEIRIDLPQTLVPARRTVVVCKNLRPCFGPPATLHVRGPERIALVGANGAGDMPSTRQLTDALTAYRGALLVASHDVAFLRTLGMTRAGCGWTAR